METYPDAVPIGPAKVQYNDFTGTVAADRADAIVGRASLEELVGLDSSKWAVQGFNLYRSPSRWTFSIYAADKVALGIKDFADWQRVVDAQGSIPVTEFYLPEGASIEDILTATFKRFAIRMFQRDTKENYSVEDRAELPFGNIKANQ